MTRRRWRRRLAERAPGGAPDWMCGRRSRRGSTHPLLAFDNVVVSPHTAGVTREARDNIARIAAEQILDIFDGRPPSRPLNPEVWPVFARRFEQAFGFAPKPIG